MSRSLNFKKALFFVISCLLLVVFTEAAMAATVTISGAVTGTYTLNSMYVDSNGNITLSVSSQTVPPSTPPSTPSSDPLSLSLNPSSLSSAAVNASYNKAVTMTAAGGTAPYTYNCSISGVTGLKATVSGSTCTVSGTPGLTGFASVIFTVTDKNFNKVSKSITLSVISSSSSTSSPSTSTLPADPSSAIELQHGVWTKGFVIPARGTLYFKVKTDSVCSKALTISVTGYASQSNPNMLVKKSKGLTEAWPTYSDYKTRLDATGYNKGQKSDGTYYWNFSSSYEGEANFIYSASPDTYYVFLYNDSSAATNIDMYYTCY